MLILWQQLPSHVKDALRLEVINDQCLSVIIRDTPELKVAGLVPGVALFYQVDHNRMKHARLDLTFSRGNDVYWELGRMIQTNGNNSWLNHAHAAWVYRMAEETLRVATDCGISLPWIVNE